MPGKRPPDGDEKKMTSSGDATQTPGGGPRDHTLGRELEEEERAANSSFYIEITAKASLGIKHKPFEQKKFVDYQWISITRTPPPTPDQQELGAAHTHENILAYQV